MAAEMEAAGVDEEQIAAFLDASAEEEDEPVFVWPVNATAFRVFINCRWRRTPVQNTEGLRMLFESIEATEVVSVCDLLGVPDCARPQVLEGVRYAETIALPILNR